MMKQETEQQEKECLAYFRANPIWHKIFVGFREKYRSFGKFAGKVVLQRITMEEIEELEGFFGQNFHGQKSITISAERFERALANSRYGAVLPERLLECFFGETIMSKQKEMQLREQRKEELFCKFRKDYVGTFVAPYLETLRILLKDSESKDLELWDKKLRLAAEIYNQLPYRNGKRVYLAMFAAQFSGNPHYFDAGTAEGALLYQIIQMDLEIREIVIESSDIFKSYQRQKSFLCAGIMVDDVSNYAMLYQVRALKQDGQYDLGMEGFWAEGHVVQVPLSVLTEWKQLECVNDEIYIVENPSIFATMCGKADEKSYMCMNGQPRLAGLMVLDLLKQAGTKIYYSGDLDPEGLLIAQKLSMYYQRECPDVDSFSYLNMEEADYEKCKSQEKLSEKRLKILEHITDPRLEGVTKLIRQYKVAGYQELL